MTLSEDFTDSICEDEVQKKILSVMRDSNLSDQEKIKILVKFIHGDKSD